MAPKKTAKRARHGGSQGPAPQPPTLRIIGGTLRGSKLQHHGDAVTRPMKDRTREAVFNLIGPQIKGAHAIDLFAGTGALALEAISRGAAGATLCERHFPTAKVIDRNIEGLKLQAVCDVVRGDAFRFTRLAELDQPGPWVIFCSPPYDLYDERNEDMLELINTWIDRAPAGSLMAVESDNRFDCDTLPHPSLWDNRRYAPAQIALLAVDDLPSA